MGKFVLLVFVIVCVNIIITSASERAKGPNPGPVPIKSNTNLRTRFAPHFQRPSADKEEKKDSGVKIVEGLSRTKSVLKSNPAAKRLRSESVDDKSRFSGRLRQNDESQQNEEFSNDFGGHSDTFTYTFPAPNPLPVMPIFQNTPKPTIANNNNHNYYGGNNNNINSNGNGLEPLIIHYQPVISGGFQTTSSPSLIPIITESSISTTSTTTEEPPFIFPASTSTFRPIPGPIGPPSATVVPIIGGSGGGVEEEETDEDLFPPAPPEEDLFPPSPPEIESVGRMLPLKSNPPPSSSFVRTRITNIGSFPSSTTSSREVDSSSRLRSGERLRSGNGRVKVRLRDKVRESMENDEGRSILQDPNVITDFVFSDIKCFKTRSKEYFGATIHMKSGYHPPYVRDRPQDPLTSNECRMDNVGGSDDVFHMTVTDLKGCGVEQCGDYMCLTMVFPRVPTLALADDEVTTIKCLPQKSTMSDTRTISFAGDSLDGRRSSSTVEGGGQDFAAEVGVFRQNPGSTNGLYVKRVNSGGVVQLGEPLQMRSIVRGGDGWKHSKLSDVKVWRMREAPTGNLDNLDPNDASEVITLVDSRGCRNEEYQVIADTHPVKDPRNDLINHFTFKAFLFRGQRAQEPLIVTAKVHACQEDADCIPKDCGSSRMKRSPVELHNSSAIVHDWDSSLALRVVGLKDHSASITEEDFPTDASNGRSLSPSNMTCAEKMATAGLGGGLIVLLLCGITIALYAYIVKGRSKRRQQNGSNFPSPYLENGGQNQHPNPNVNLSTHPARQQPLQMFQQQGSSPPNKPLPPTPTTQNSAQPLPPPHNNNSIDNKLSNSEINQMAKILHRLTDKGNTEKRVDQVVDYECIDESSSTSVSSSSGDVSSSKKQSQRKKDGVYIVYIDKNNKTHRPKSAPPSLRKSLKNKSRKKAIQVFDSESPSQTEEATEEESEDSSGNDSSGSDGMSNSNQANKSKCVGFGGRRTVRNIKSRSSHHHNRSSQDKQHKVVSGIRRRLSSFYNDAKMQQFKSGFGLGASKGGSFPSRGKSGSGQRPISEISEEACCSSSLGQHSSDLDSAYYGSELNDDGLLNEMRQLATQHRASKKYFAPTTGSAALKQDLNNNLAAVKMQLRSGNGPMSSPLGPGQTKAAHFVTRNDTSTQILIVPETHV